MRLLFSKGSILTKTGDFALNKLSVTSQIFSEFLHLGEFQGNYVAIIFVRDHRFTLRRDFPSEI